MKFFIFTKQSLLEQRQYLIPMFIWTPWSVDIEKERKKIQKWKKIEGYMTPTPVPRKRKNIVARVKHNFLFVFDDMKDLRWNHVLQICGTMTYIKRIE